MRKGKGNNDDGNFKRIKAKFSHHIIRLLLKCGFKHNLAKALKNELMGKIKELKIEAKNLLGEISFSPLFG